MVELKARRNITLDILKGVAIFLVVIGHRLEYSMEVHDGVYMVRYDMLFKIIYSFHMPLFMLISGYLFYFSARKYSVSDLVKSRFTKILMPILIWTIIDKLLIMNFSLIGVLFSFISKFWFLWALFYNSMAVLSIKKFFNDRPIFYLMLFLLLFVTPDIMGFELYKFMYPYFVGGYLFASHGKPLLLRMQDKQVKLLLVFLPVYIGMLAFYNYDSYIYVSGISVLGSDPLYQFVIDIHRYAIGFVGSLLMIILVNILKDRLNLGVFAQIGKRSLGIYIFSEYIFGYSRIFVENLSEAWSSNYLVVLLSSAGITAICYLLTVLMNKYKPTRRLLLGGH